jgi:hypothetical protein
VLLWVAVEQSNIYVQGNAEVYCRLPREERYRIACFLYLHLRFQSRILHRGLDARTCAKAGLSQRHLIRILRKLMNYPTHMSEGGVGFLSGKNPKTGDWHILELKKLIKQRYFYVLAAKPTKARNTLVLSCSMSIAQIMKAIDLKMFQHHHAQVIKAREKGPGGTKGDRQRASNAVNYPVHPDLIPLEPEATKYQAPIPLSSIAALLGVSVRTASRRVSEWDADGAVRRTKRRIKLSAAPDNIKAFHEKWGGMPFERGGLWYAQFSNVYEILTDYRGPYALLRRDRKGYGKSVSEMLGTVRN